MKNEGTTRTDYVSFFGMHENPFRMTPDRDFYFKSSNHSALGRVLQFGLDEGEGFIVVVGEVGTGKTMAVRQLVGNLYSQAEVALILAPQLSPRELILAILQDVGQTSYDKHDDLFTLLSHLNSFLYDLSQKGKRLIVIIDEAHDMLDESIEQLRLLSNFESDKHKLLQIILVGQPELKKKMEQPQLRQLLQRIMIFETLLPLSKYEMTSYVHYRLRRAGRSDLRLSWSARRALWLHTKGVPRQINKVMGRALLVAYANRLNRISTKCIHTAADALSMRGKTAWYFPSPAMMRRFGVGVLFPVGIALAVFLLEGRLPENTIIDFITQLANASVLR